MPVFGVKDTVEGPLGKIGGVIGSLLGIPGTPTWEFRGRLLGNSGDGNSGNSGNSGGNSGEFRGRGNSGDALLNCLGIPGLNSGIPAEFRGRLT